MEKAAGSNCIYDVLFEMNSMHNSFSGSGGGGGYSSPYPGYVPSSALPYYNGYPGDLCVSQGPGGIYGKPAPGMPGYSTWMAGYSAPGINNSMYYQQYGLGYQYGYGKYGIAAASGLPSGMGYGPDIGNPASIPPSALGGLQAPTTDLGLTGSMFSKGSSSISSGATSTISNNISSSSSNSTVGVGNSTILHSTSINSGNNITSSGNNTLSNHSNNSISKYSSISNSSAAVHNSQTTVI